MPTEKQLANLVSLGSRTTSERRAIAKKAAAASAKVRRQNATFREAARALMDDGHTLDEILDSMAREAKKGSVAAAAFIRDTAGEKPRENAEITGNLTMIWGGEDKDEQKN